MNTYTLLMDDGRLYHLPGVRIEAVDDVEAVTVAETVLRATPSVQHVVVMRRSAKVAIVSRADEI